MRRDINGFTEWSASNEFEDAWMDEGINQFVNARVDAEHFGGRGRLVRRYFGGFIPWAFKDIRWDRVTFGEFHFQLSRRRHASRCRRRPSYQYWPGNPRRRSPTRSPPLWLHTLERALGWPMMQRILSTYFERWQFRHPKPEDFFQVANEAERQRSHAVLRSGVPRIVHVRLRRGEREERRRPAKTTTARTSWYGATATASFRSRCW